MELDFLSDNENKQVLMACVHCWTRIQITTEIRIPNLGYSAEHVHVTQTLISDSVVDSETQSLLFSFLGWVSVSELGSESASGNVNKP